MKEISQNIRYGQINSFVQEHTDELTKTQKFFL